MSCELCPLRCGAGRPETAGRCRVSALRVGRAAPHFGEEPCISGERGSGTVFFAGCTLRCVFCQNYELSRGRQGQPVSIPVLADIFRRLERQGVHNLNLVTGTPFVPPILRALELAEPEPAGSEAAGVLLEPPPQATRDRLMAAARASARNFFMLVFLLVLCVVYGVFSLLY